MSYMKYKFKLALNLNSQQTAMLSELQREFANVCNSISPIVKESRCWNRVGLHHLVYRLLREQFPTVGSQMICNAIYSVSRVCRKVYQDPNSQWAITKRPGRSLPLLKFGDDLPVYFDRHTLNIKNGQLSMYTLEGRLRFKMKLPEQLETCFSEEKLAEVALFQKHDVFYLAFTFGHENDVIIDEDNGLPEYVVVLENANAESAQSEGDE